MIKGIRRYAPEVCRQTRATQNRLASACAAGAAGRARRALGVRHLKHHRDREPQRILDAVLTFALEFRDSRPLHQVRLLCESANRVDGAAARALLQQENALVPLGQWPRATLLSVISCLEPPSRPVVVSAVIRALSKEGRVRQLRAIPQLFQVLSRLDLSTRPNPGERFGTLRESGPDRLAVAALLSSRAMAETERRHGYQRDV